MRLHRFYVSQPLGEDVVIEDVSIIKQWLKVFRYKEGSLVILFNGDGYNYHYSIHSSTPSVCNLTLVEKHPSYIPNKKVTLYLSLIKKDNFELAVQKATELGVTTIVPIISERSEKKNLNDDRLKKIALESSEQSCRGDIPTISSIVTLSQALETAANSNKEMVLVLNMSGVPFSDLSLQESLRSSTAISLFIGPEGGWSDTEEKMFKENKITAVSLGKTILRAETAAITACALPLLL